MTTPVVTMRGVTKTFHPPGAPAVPVLHGVDLQVLPGEIVAIVGRSGSGKSTLLNILGLLDRPTTGTYCLRGRTTHDLTERERDRARGELLGFVFQAFHLVDHLDVLHNVLVPLEIDGVPRRARRSRALHALHDVGLGHRVNASPRTLSGGERQRVAIARALVREPALLLCDEPTGSLDLATGRDVLARLQAVAARGCAVALVTHDSAVASIADRTVRIDQGRLC